MISSLFRALADILRQQGPIPIAHCERETISAINTSPKENTPVRSSSKNHYTPVRTAKQTPGKRALIAFCLCWGLVRGFGDVLSWWAGGSTCAMGDSTGQAGLRMRPVTVSWGGTDASGLEESSDPGHP